MGENGLFQTDDYFHRHHTDFHRDVRIADFTIFQQHIYRPVRETR